MALINPGTNSSSIYDPTLPNRIAQGTQQAPASPDTISSVGPGQGPQYNPSFGSDQSPAGAAPPPGTYPASFPVTADYKPSFDASAPLSSILARASGPQNALLARTPMPPVRPAGLGAPAQPQTAQAPAPATPQGWNLFTALGQALGHLLGFNAAGQPQGMSGLIRPNPVQTAPTQTAGFLRMPNNTARYQRRTLIG